MARTNNLENFLTDVADAIREKTEKTASIPASNFDTEIRSISTGGGLEVIDNLTSSSTTDALSANQGRILNNNKVATSRTIAGKALSANITAADLASALQTEMGKLMYPVGSIYMSVSNTNPSTLFGGTWVAWGSGQVPVGIKSGDADFGTVEKTGGEKEHQLTTYEMPSHKHDYTVEGHAAKIPGWVYSSGGDRFSLSDSGYLIENPGLAGGNQPHNNLQPYITCYMWKRTA